MPWWHCKLVHLWICGGKNINVHPDDAKMFVLQWNNFIGHPIMCRTIYDICNDKYMQRKYISYQKCFERPTSHSVPALSRHGEIRFINLFIDFESFGDDLIINSNLNVWDQILLRISFHLQGQTISYTNIIMQRHHGVLIHRSVLLKHRVFIWVASGKRRSIHTLVNTRPWWEPIILYCKSRL